MHSEATSKRRWVAVGRRALGLIAVAAAVCLTMANSAGPRSYYERELLSGDDIILEDEAWDESGNCLPPITLKKTATKVQLVGSQGNLLASAQCNDGSNCMAGVHSFVSCNVYGAQETVGTEGESITTNPDVSCTTDPDAASASHGEGNGGGPDIKKCNDEMRITVEFQDGSTEEARFRQLFVTESSGDYLPFYPG